LQHNNNIEKKKDSYVLSDISYQNDAVFMGRFDSITHGILPSMGHYDYWVFLLAFFILSNRVKIE
jgi:hypothetical protein